MSSSISPLIASLFMEEFKAMAISSAPHPLVVAQVSGWHLCHPTGRTLSSVHPAHPVPSTHTSSSPWKTPKEMVLHLSWIPLSPRDQTTPHNISLQKIHPHRSIPSPERVTVTFQQKKKKHVQYFAHRARMVCTNHQALKQEEDHIRQHYLDADILHGT